MYVYTYKTPTSPKSMTSPKIKIILTIVHVYIIHIVSSYGVYLDYLVKCVWSVLVWSGLCLHQLFHKFSLNLYSIMLSCIKMSPHNTLHTVISTTSLHRRVIWFWSTLTFIKSVFDHAGVFSG